MINQLATFSKLRTFQSRRLRTNVKSKNIWRWSKTDESFLARQCQIWQCQFVFSYDDLKSNRHVICDYSFQPAVQQLLHSIWTLILLHRISTLILLYNVIVSTANYTCDMLIVPPSSEDAIRGRQYISQNSHTFKIDVWCAMRNISCLLKYFNNMSICVLIWRFEF